MFLTLLEILDEDDDGQAALQIKDQIIRHLTSLSEKLEEWFGDLPGDEYDWVRTPTHVKD